MEGIPQASDAFFRFLQSALVPTSLLYSISHTSLARVFSVFHQKQEMHSSDFSSSTDFTIEGDITPSLADPALLSVVGVVDG